MTVPDVEFHAEDLPWIVLPTAFPSAEFSSATEAGGRILGYFQQREGGSSAGTSYGMKLASHLESLARGQYSALFLWRTEPLVPPAIVTAELYAAQGDASVTLPLLGGAAHGEPFVVPGLGAGTRYEVTSQVRKGLFGKATRYTLRWVWRIDEVDLVVTLERDDAAEVALLTPDVEALLAAATVTSAA